MLFMALIVSPFIMFIYLHCNPYPLVFRCLKESGLTAFFTRSSAANIQMCIRDRCPAVFPVRTCK